MKERVDLVKKCAMRSLAGVGATRFSLKVLLFVILIFWFKLVRLWGKYFFGFTLEYFYKVEERISALMLILAKIVVIISSHQLTSFSY